MLAVKAESVFSSSLIYVDKLKIWLIVSNIKCLYSMTPEYECSIITWLFFNMIDVIWLKVKLGDMLQSAGCFLTEDPVGLVEIQKHKVHPSQM